MCSLGLSVEQMSQSVMRVREGTAGVLHLTFLTVRHNLLVSGRILI